MPSTPPGPGAFTATGRPADGEGSRGDLPPLFMKTTYNFTHRAGPPARRQRAGHGASIADVVSEGRHRRGVQPRRGHRYDVVKALLPEDAPTARTTSPAPIGKPTPSPSGARRGHVPPPRRSRRSHRLQRRRRGVGGRHVGAARGGDVRLSASGLENDVGDPLASWPASDCFRRRQQPGSAATWPTATASSWDMAMHGMGDTVVDGRHPRPGAGRNTSVIEDGTDRQFLETDLGEGSRSSSRSCSNGWCAARARTARHARRRPRPGDAQDDLG